MVPGSVTMMIFMTVFVTMVASAPSVVVLAPSAVGMIPLNAE